MRPGRNRGALFHAVQVTMDAAGTVTGRVHQAFGGVRRTF